MFWRMSDIILYLWGGRSSFGSYFQDHLLSSLSHIMFSWCTSRILVNSCSQCLTSIPCPLTPKSQVVFQSLEILDLGFIDVSFSNVHYSPHVLYDYLWIWGLMCYLLEIFGGGVYVLSPYHPHYLQNTTIDHSTFPLMFWKRVY